MRTDSKKKLTKKRAYPSRTYLSITLLLAQFLLIKLGSIPFNTIKFANKNLLLILKNIQKKLAKSPAIKKYGAANRAAGRRLANPKRAKVPAFWITLTSQGRAVFFAAASWLNTLPRLNIPKIPKKIKFPVVSLTLLSLFLLYTYATFQLAYQLPNPTRLVSPNQPLTTEIYDRNNKLLFRLYEGRNRSLIKLIELPQHLIQATLAAEDKNFYHHPGIDFVAITRAFVNNLRGGQLEGGSTITQQLIKNTLLSPEKTYSRKLKEVILALWAERIYSKDQILQMYLNEAPYGGTVWGIEAAALTYFEKEAKDLTLGESAYLAGLPASPTQFNPYGGEEKLTKLRQKQILGRMVEAKFITQHQADQAGSEALQIKPYSNNIKAPHFVMYIKDLLSQKYGPRVVSQGGLKIKTTLDLNLQEEVQQIVKEEVEKLAPLNVSNGAAMVLDPKTGQILAMVGSKDYYNPAGGAFNVTTSLRQPGSSIKPVTYAAAFKAGFNPGNTILDTPVTFKSPFESYSPVNYDGKFHGPVSIRVALGSSLNTTAVKMLSTVGMDSFLTTAGDLGITTFNQKDRYGLSITLGGAEVKLVDMMAMYATFANLGVKKVPTGILAITDSTGNIIEQYDDLGTPILQPAIAYLIADILKDNQARSLAFGTNSLLNVSGVAVKTGTSDNKRDNWAFGFTPDFVVGSWVGNNNNSPMNPALSSGITGATPIWRRITDLMISKIGVTAFQKPKGVIEGRIDGRVDLVIADITPKSLVRIKKEEDKTTFFDNFSAYATSSAQASPEPRVN